MKLNPTLRAVCAGMMLLAVALPGACNAQGDKTVKIKFENAFYYKDGKFDEEKAKDAVVALLRHHGYPVYPGLREKLWITDYGLGRFAEVGLAAVMWVNNEKDHYMMLDIFLMPDQMLPEHWHQAAKENPSKLEGWLVRYGLSHIVGEGEPNLTVKVPRIHNGGKVTVQHEVAAKPGDFVPLNREGAHHWQFAGPEGAIITEVANIHTNAGVRHLDKAMNDFFLKDVK
jgi:hypothetical protein